MPIQSTPSEQSRRSTTGRRRAEFAESILSPQRQSVAATGGRRLMLIYFRDGARCSGRRRTVLAPVHVSDNGRGGCGGCGAQSAGDRRAVPGTALSLHDRGGKVAPWLRRRRRRLGLLAVTRDTRQTPRATWGGLPARLLVHDQGVRALDRVKGSDQGVHDQAEHLWRTLRNATLRPPPRCSRCASVVVARRQREPLHLRRGARAARRCSTAARTGSPARIHNPY